MEDNLIEILSVLARVILKYVGTPGMQLQPALVHLAKPTLMLLIPSALLVGDYQATILLAPLNPTAP